MIALGVRTSSFAPWNLGFGSLQVPRGCFYVADSVAVLLVFVRSCSVVVLDIKVDRLEVPCGFEVVV